MTQLTSPPKSNAYVTADAVLATYEEWQQDVDDAPHERLSKVLFRRDDDALHWLHVHKTWLEG